MTRKLVSLTLLALLVSSFTAVAAPKDAPAAQKVDGKSLGPISCVASSIEKYPDGTLKKCIITEAKTAPGANVTCSANQPLSLHPEGTLAQCILAVDRSYPDPLGVTCDDGKVIAFYPDGSLAKCTPAVEKKATLLGVTCAITAPMEVYPDGMLKQCFSTVEKVVPASPTKEVHVSEITCAKNNIIGFNEKGRVNKCVPTESVYMRGKGTCLPGEPISLQADGKVQECTYTYPLYQNRSCKVESRVSFHENGNFKDCTLPEDRTVGTVVCKGDAPISYRANGNVASCTLAAQAEKAPGNVIKAGTVVEFDEQHKIR